MSEEIIRSFSGAEMKLDILTDRTSVLFSKIWMKLVGTARLELATSPLSEERSNLLSYAPEVWARINLVVILSKKSARFWCLVVIRQTSAHPYQVNHLHWMLVKSASRLRYHCILSNISHSKLKPHPWKSNIRIHKKILGAMKFLETMFHLQKLIDSFVPEN